MVLFDVVELRRVLFQGQIELEVFAVLQAGGQLGPVETGVPLVVVGAVPWAERGGIVEKEDQRIVADTVVVAADLEMTVELVVGVDETGM